jgi:hypothetical protein
MSRAVRQFLHLVRDNEQNERISQAWETLSLEEQLEAEDLAETVDTMEMEIPLFAVDGIAFSL